MKKFTKIILLLLMLGTFSRCIYESSVPIDKANMPIDTKLMFTWEEQGSHDVYTLTKMDDYSCRIKMYSQLSKQYSQMGAFFSVIDGTLFLNLWHLKADEQSRKYKIVKLEWIDDRNFKIYPLTENIREQFDTSEKLKEFIRDNMKDSFLYDAPGMFKRVASK